MCEQEENWSGRESVEWVLLVDFSLCDLIFHLNKFNRYCCSNSFILHSVVSFGYAVLNYEAVLVNRETKIQRLFLVSGWCFLSKTIPTCLPWFIVIIVDQHVKYTNAWFT